MTGAKQRLDGELLQGVVLMENAVLMGYQLQVTTMGSRVDCGVAASGSWGKRAYVSGARPAKTLAWHCGSLEIGPA